MNSNNGRRRKSDVNSVDVVIFRKIERKTEVHKTYVYEVKYELGHGLKILVTIIFYNSNLQ